jgi:hypothetical protein
MSKPEFVYVTYIETTPEKLWKALTDGDFTERYWFGVRLKSDWPAISKGWPAILSNLKSMLETGRTLEVPFAALKMEEAG